MNSIAKGLIVAGLVLCAGPKLCATGQALQKPVGKYAAPARGDETRVYLEPQQEMETVEVSEGCLTFLTEVRFSIALPFGATAESVLPAGSSWAIPLGKYKPNNPTKAPVEYVLKAGRACGDTPPNGGARSPGRVR